MDADRKLYTFDNWYKIMYNKKKSIISCLCNFDKLEKCKDGYKIHLYENVDIIKHRIKEKGLEVDSKSIEYLVQKNNELKDNHFYSFRLSGDADYQLLDKNKCKESQMHMFPNFSLIPVTGNLQIIKNTQPLKNFLSNDLKKYFDNRDIQFIPYRRWGRQYSNEEQSTKKENLEKETLKAFFDIFDSLDTYCKNMYFMNGEEIKKFDVNKYWQKRKEIAKECGISEEELGQDISLRDFI